MVEKTRLSLPASASQCVHSAGATPWFLFAPGAGAPSSSPWMRRFRGLLERLGPVECFDYAYQLQGRRSPDRLPLLIRAHREAFEARRASGPVVLIGKSMGGRIGCHLALELDSRACLGLVCLGYPLVGRNKQPRDQVIRDLRTPVLFVQGTRDALCPLLQLNEVRKGMTALNFLHVVEGGDHSLRLTASALKAQATTQDSVDDAILDAIRDFVGRIQLSSLGSASLPEASSLIPATREPS